MYTLARQLLFKLSPETSHELSIDLIGAGGRLGLNRLLTPKPASLPVSVLGLEFPNPVGLAAGLDKNGDAIDGFGQLGFGFIEIGTVTPRPQPGNPKPRLFRLPQANAIINRMGFNNHGVDHLLARVRAAKYRGVLGINIGKGLPHGDEAGGLSGAPVREKSTHTVKVLAGELGGRLPIIAAGGITEGAHAAEKIAAGASLVQIYSGFIYKGPALIREAVDAIAALPRRN